jgi:hypothetical protein
MKRVTIIEEQGHIAVFDDECHYDAYFDKATGDWQVTSDDDELVQGEWMMTRDDAMKYILEQAGVIVDANHERAPDRTSA